MGATATSVLAPPMTTPPVAVPPTKMHKVTSGETLSSIAQRYYGAESQWSIVAKANPTVDPNRLKIGTLLVIPDAPTGTASRDARAGPAPTTPAETTTVPAGSQKYVIQNGDTFWTMAEHFYQDGSKWPVIYKANKRLLGDNPNRLPVGKTLIIPPAPARSNVPTGTGRGEGNK